MTVKVQCVVDQPQEWHGILLTPGPMEVSEEHAAEMERAGLIKTQKARAAKAADAEKGE